MQSEVVWQSKMHFIGELEGYELPIDADVAVGGQDLGPKPLLLTALAGCTGMDVINSLRKMRLEPKPFKVLAAGDVAAVHPKVFTHIHLSYRLAGDLPRDQVEKAIKLSQDRYCPVSAMLKQVVPIEWDLTIVS
jgi:putative redox protein